LLKLPLQLCFGRDVERTLRARCRALAGGCAAFVIEPAWVVTDVGASSVFDFPSISTLTVVPPQRARRRST